MPGTIYIHRDGKNYGPLTVEETVNLAKTGGLAAGDPVWTGDTEKWVRAADVTFLDGVFGAMPAEPPQVQYYVRVGEETAGPMALDEVIGMVKAGRLKSDDLVWHAEEKRWKRGAEVLELAPHFVSAIYRKAGEPAAEPEGTGEVAGVIERKYAADFQRDKAMLSTVDDDRNFLKTLVFVSLLYVMVILTVNFVYVPETDEETSLEIFHRVAKLVVDEPIAIEAIEEAPVTDVPEGVSTGNGTGSGGGSGPGTGGEPGGDDFASAGVVGLITSLSGTGNVVDMIGTGGDLDLAVSGLGGLKTGGTPTIGTGGGLGSGLGPGGGLGMGGGEGLGMLADKNKTMVGMTNLKNARISTTPPSISGSAVGHSKRSSAVIAAVVNRHKTGIEYIYKKYLKTNPGMEGKIVVRFTIAASGAVTYSAVVASTIGHPAFEGEVAARITTWKFPEIEAGEVTVDYPFVFFAAGG
ncbi:MAG: TonB family protein [Candidatus Coatesbacteria bacterium]|nr:MAG: TonB family protein [Candidatus Coatesbacteria bacterium]